MSYLDHSASHMYSEHGVTFEELDEVGYEHAKMNACITIYVHVRSSQACGCVLCSLGYGKGTQT